MSFSTVNLCTNIIPHIIYNGMFEIMKTWTNETVKLKMGVTKTRYNTL